MTRLAPHNSARRAGFTLIEVLCALLLIGVVLPIAMRGISLSLLAASTARHTSEAAELARHKLAELALSTDAGAYVSTGDFGTDWPEYKWESTSTQRDFGVSEVTVTVTWKSRGNDVKLSLATLAYPGAYVIPTATESTTATPAPGGTP